MAQLLCPAAGSRHGGLYVRLLFLIFNDSCQTNYLKMYRTDLRQVLKADICMWMTNLKLVFRSLKGRCHDNQFLSVLSTERIRWTQAASGAAGRANVGLCRASIVSTV